MILTPDREPMALDAVLTAHDGSLLLATASLHRIADAEGTAAFGDLAVAYREDYLRARAEQRGGTATESGSLSVDEARAHLATSVLPRLMQLQVIGPLAADVTDGTRISVAPAAWARLQTDTGFSAALTAAIAASFASPAEAAPSAAPVTGGSRLEASELSKSYRGRRVVDEVSVNLAQGEIVGLLGPNGAGKTTTFYIITGIIRPDAGTVRLDGGDLTGLPMFRRARAGIGYLAQEPSVFRKLTVEENILAILETLPITAAERSARLEQLLDELAIKHLRTQKAYQLSGGERRRLEITRALVTEPRFMLLDEPFAGVDPIAVHDIQTIVASLRHRGIGVLITDHNVEQTLDIVDRAYIMFEGKVQVSGTVRELVYNDRVADLYLGPTLTARLRARLATAA